MTATPMSPAETPFVRVVEAELRKLASRTSARVSLALTLVGALLIPLVLLLVKMGVVRAAGADAESDPASYFTAARAMHGVLIARNFFVARAFIIWVVAEVVAGELVLRTLREDLLRPVKRVVVVAAKWTAVQVFVLALTVLPLLASALLSLILFGVGETSTLSDELRGFALSWPGDVGFATMVILIALLLRSVPATVMGVFLYWVIDQALGFVLWGVEKARPWIENILIGRQMEDLMSLVDGVIAVRPWLPSAAFNVYWDYDPEIGFIWQSWASLLVLTVVCFVGAVVRLHRIDID